MRIMHVLSSPAAGGAETFVRDLSEGLVDEGHEVREVKLQNPDLLNQPITALDLPDGVTVLLIERGGDILVPDEDTVLRANDTVMLVGGEVDETARLFARQS